FLAARQCLRVCTTSQTHSGPLSSSPIGHSLAIPKSQLASLLTFEKARAQSSRLPQPARKDHRCYAFPLKLASVLSANYVCRLSERPRKRQLVPIRVWRVKIAFTPCTIARCFRVKAVFLQVAPESVHIRHVQ